MNGSARSRTKPKRGVSVREVTGRMNESTIRTRMEKVPKVARVFSRM